MPGSTTKATRTAIVRWMRNVLEAQKWTAQEWARQADTSATNITRALGPRGPMPTAATLAKLVAVAGSHPDFSGGKRDAQGMFFSVPLLHGPEVDKLVGKMGTETQEAWLTARALEGPVVATLYRPSDRAFAVRIDVASLTGRGIFPQDTVIVEPNDILPLEAGCIVVVRSEGQTGAYEYRPPYLLPHVNGTTMGPIMIDNATIVGRAVHLQRSL